MRTIKDILDYLDNLNISYKFYGDKKLVISGFSSLKHYQIGTLTWLGRQGAIPENLNENNITLAIIQNGIDSKIKNRIITEESKRAFFSTIESLFEETEVLPEIGYGTYIGKNVRIGENVKIGHNCSLDGNIVIGDNTIIYNNVNIINKVSIGNNCVIQSGVSIGHDGYGFSEDQSGKKYMIKHHGGVTIKDNVYISSNTVIQRGTIDDTIIEEGTKIDTLCHIAHNVHLGKNNALVTLTGMYGSSVTGENCYIASAIIKDNISIGNHVQVGMSSTVMKNTDDDVIVIGTPAKVHKKR